jgi:hypothetical protein
VCHLNGYQTILILPEQFHVSKDKERVFGSAYSDIQHAPISIVKRKGNVVYSYSGRKNHDIALGALQAMDGIHREFVDNC